MTREEFRYRLINDLLEAFGGSALLLVEQLIEHGTLTFGEVWNLEISSSENTAAKKSNKSVSKTNRPEDAEMLPRR